MSVEQILKDPEALKALLKQVDAKKILAPLKDATEKKEGIKVSKKYDRYEQFTGIMITVTHKRITEGKKSFSIRANGRSEKDTEILAEEEVARLKRRYHIA
jgi:hypothetical protein